MGNRAFRRCVVALAGFGLLAGCGDDGSPSGITAERPAETATQPERPQARYLAELDALCKRSAEEVGALREGVGAAQRAMDYDRMVTLLEHAISLAEQDYRTVAALDVPPSERDFIAAYLGYFRRTTELSKAVARAVRRRDFDASQRLSNEARRVADERDALLNGHGGFRYCGVSN
jgi:hypothetical protein